MPTGLSRPLAAVARRLAPPPAGSDAELLDQYRLTRDEAAFAALVRRHAPAVRAVARARLANHADADDVTQATFLVLARDAGRVRESVAGWLVRVAHLTALQHRRNLARRRTEALPEHVEGGDGDPVAAAAARETAAVVAEELAALPDRLRAVVALCGLDGLTAAVAADRLGVPKGTVDSRLATAKRRLAARLARRGVAAGAVATLAAVPAPAEFAEAASVAACAYAGPAGAPVTPVSLLADGVRPAMSATTRLFALGMVAAAVTGTAGTALYHGGPADDKPTAQSPQTAKPADPKPTASLTLNTTGEADPPKPAGRSLARNETDVRSRLAEPCGIADVSSLNLGTLLAELNSPDRGLIVRLDIPAIMRYGISEDLQATLYDFKLRSRTDPRLPLSDFLDVVLSQLDLRDFPVTYRVRGNQILIGPATLARNAQCLRNFDALYVEQVLGEPVHVAFYGVPLTEVVAQLRTVTGANIVLDPKAAELLKAPITGTFDDVRLVTVLRLTAHMAGLSVVTTGNVYYLTDPASALKLQSVADAEERKAAEKASPKG